MLGFALGSALGKGLTTVRMQWEAVKNGAAEWHADDDGSAMFKWKKP